MTAAALRPTRTLDVLRRSMTVQTSLAIALASVLCIVFFASLLDGFVARELRQQNELLLMSNLAFVREDVLASEGDPAALARAVRRTSDRTPWLHAAVFRTGDPRPLARSPGFEVPLAGFPPAIDAALLPPDAGTQQLDELRPVLARNLKIWVSPEGRHFRLLRGVIHRPGGDVTVALALETTAARQLRNRTWDGLEAELLGAAVLSILFGIWIARVILGNARRFGATAGRIDALDLRERLDVSRTPLELRESATAFNNMLDRLQNAFERLAAFSSELAHDLRTPVNNLLGEAQVALSRPRSAEEYRSVLESAVEEYERMSRMIASMLFLARADSRHAAPEPRAVDLDAALARVMGYFELLADERGLSMRMEIQAAPGAPRRVWADETMLVRALGNLVSNAVQHATPGTTIELTAHVAHDDSCALAVSNAGAVIPPEQQALVFERFYRGDRARQAPASGTGLGLGLAIVRSIMEMHGGRASVRSAPGSGTVFTLHFPAPPRD